MQTFQMDILTKARNRYTSANFIFNPTAEYDSETLQVLFESRYNNQTPKYSIVMPIHNQEEVIQKHLTSILANTSELFEMILILDACSDKSTEQVMIFATAMKCPLLTRCVVFSSSLPLFETAADNLGFYCAEGEFVLEIQADIDIIQYGYQQRLAEPFKYFPNLLGVSGRGCHFLLKPEAVGRCTHQVEYPLPPEYPKNMFYVAETCIRGPLLIHREKLVEMGYLDEVHFFLDNSDHDLFLRAYVEKGWICGYIPVDYISILKNGSMRKKRDPINEFYYNKKQKAFLEHDGGKLQQYLQDMQCNNISRSPEAYQIH